MAKIKYHYGKPRVRWTDEHGIRQSRNFDNEFDAQVFLERETLRVREVKRGLSPTLMLKKTFQDLSEYWLKHRTCLKRSAKDDLSIINTHLSPSFGKLKLQEITIQRIDYFKIQKTHLSDKTVHNILTLLISMLKQANDLGWLQKVPRIKKPKIILLETDFHYLKSKDEVDRFLQAAHDHSLLHGMLYQTAAYTGCREGELAALTRQDIDFNRRLITVRRSFQGPTKNGRTRVVPILDALFEPLKNWLEINPLETVFPNANGQMMKPCARIFQEHLKVILKRAGFAERQTVKGTRGYIVFHDLRHTFSSHWVMNGGDLFKLKNILGHQDITMTQRYAHLSPHAFSKDYTIFGTSNPKPMNVIQLVR